MLSTDSTLYRNAVRVHLANNVIQFAIGTREAIHFARMQWYKIACANPKVYNFGLCTQHCMMYILYSYIYLYDDIRIIIIVAIGNYVYA